MQFAGVGPDYPVLNEIREMYKKQGKPAPKEMASTVFYNRGVLIAALHVEAIRNALKASPTARSPARTPKRGSRRSRTHARRTGAAAQDHAERPRGGGLVQIWQVKDGKFVKVTDWYAAYQDVVAKHIKEAGAKK